MLVVIPSFFCCVRGRYHKKWHNWELHDLHRYCWQILILEVSHIYSKVDEGSLEGDKVYWNEVFEDGFFRGGQNDVHAILELLKIIGLKVLNTNLTGDHNILCFIFNWLHFFLSKFTILYYDTLAVTE